jgi:plasmid stabilization system protein ParE
MPRFRIHQQVVAEFEEVVAWYARLSPRAADNFILCFESGLDKARLHPSAQAPWQPPFRRVRLRRFPYLLIFHADRETISVLALVHERREPLRTFDTLARRRAQF